MNLMKVAVSSLMMLAGMAGSGAYASDTMTEITDRIPACSPGSIRRFSARCEQLDDSFTVDVWLPDSYAAGSEECYPVVYMHDGQNLFDPSISYVGAAWEIDLAIEKLSALGIIHTPIVVGIHNRSSKRPADYIPRKPVMDYIAEADRAASGMWSLVGNTFNGDDYMAFIAKTLKPEIDHLFRTLSDRDNTFIMGSSMGGLASFYALCEYPDVFGGAACLSTHWIGNFDYDNTIFPTAMLAYLSDHLPEADTHRLYLDRGTEDLDSSYGKWEEMARELVRGKGYTEEKGNLHVFTDEGATHNEVYWAARVDRPLHFLLASTDDPYVPGDTEMKDHYVVFQDAAYPWSRVNVFTWAPGVLQTGSWPGKPMKQIIYNGAPAWEFRFTHKISPTNIIFNNGSSQTADLDFRNNYVYTFKGPSAPVDISGLAVEAISVSPGIRTERGLLIVESVTSRDMEIYTPDGRVMKFTLAPGSNSIRLPQGIYVTEGRKIVIR